MEPDDDIDIEGLGLLDQDTIPNENQSLSCFSCNEPMTGLYCHACGQKNDNYRRSIWSLGAELFVSITAYDGRIWRSLRSLVLSPGKMAREYADGARQKWTSPVRLYLAMSLILFGYIAVSQTQLIAFGPKAKPNSAMQIGDEETGLVPGVYFLEREKRLKELITDEDMAAFEQKILSVVKGDDEKTDEELKDEIRINNAGINRLKEQLNDMESQYGRIGLEKGIEGLQNRNSALTALLEKQNNVQVSIQSESEVTPESNSDDDKDENGTNISITGIDGQKYTLKGDSMRAAAAEAIRKPELINSPMNKYLPRIMFLMMPFSMLIGAFFIRGRETAMLYDHLVHAAYIHAFSFLLLFIFILLVQFTKLPHLLAVYTLILLIYLPLSAKRMYKRGWFKTFLTSYGVGALYTFVMGIILIFLLSFGIIEIASQFAEPTS